MIKASRADTQQARSKINTTIFYLSLACSLVIVLNLGYENDFLSTNLLDKIIRSTFYIIGALLVLRLLLSFTFSQKLTLITYSEVLLLLYFIVIITASHIKWETYYFHFQLPAWIYVGIFATLLIELSKNSLFFDKFYFNPTILFVLSFLFLILLGTSLLLLPKATNNGSLSFIDSIFTATSAVCITGLSIYDFSTKFTQFGQTIILILFQLGGLGIMTFTGFFGYFFTGGFSYKNQLMYTELLGENKIASVINTLYKIIFITLFFEAIGAVFIYFSIDASTFQSNTERIYFSVFHAISAFCNAGFSTVEQGINNPGLRFNYNLQFILALLIILGGLGFGIVLNVYSFIKRWIKNFYRLLIYKERFIYKAWVISFNSRIILSTTFFLILFASAVIFILEYNNTLAEHQSLIGKTVNAFFLGVSPRTAGFSSVNVANLSMPIIFLYLFLMWIGASPGSTGGGIKTTTFAVAFLNIFSIAKGKENIEVFKRQITNHTVTRALTIITLSFIVIGISLFILSISDGDKGFKSLVFEVFSAFSTAGLSLGITPSLSNTGKIVLIFTMFIGRVGALTLLLAFIKNARLKAYKYPSENIEL